MPAMHPFGRESFIKKNFETLNRQNVPVNRFSALYFKNPALYMNVSLTQTFMYADNYINEPCVSI